MEKTQANALGGRSVAESSIVFVILSACLVVVAFIVTAIIWFVLLDKSSATEQERQVLRRCTWGVWAFLSFLLWRSTLLRLRRLPHIDLSEDGFFKFQLASAVCVLAFWLLLRWIPNDNSEFSSVLRLIFEVLIALFSITFISFAWGTGKHVPGKIYLGLLINIILLAAWGLG
ncbi:MAG: hypothetical protein NTY53_13615 [Kiritimatiellaeota bacterium]|nr:hypothetical protein [Kiritimatiellota bacterium]